MKQAFTLFTLVMAGLLLARRQIGYDATYQIACGAIILMSVLIAGTFLWLWRARATPLALGMVFSWAGSASVLSWWWGVAALGQAAPMGDHPILLLFVALYTSGAVLHFFVIQRSLHLPEFSAVALPSLAFAISAGVSFLT